MFFEEFAVGQTFDIKPVAIEREKMLAFAREYDPVDLHLDENYASGTHFGGLIAPGVMSFMTVWAQFVRTGILHEALIAGYSTKITWHAPVYPGDILTGRATITNLIDRNAYNGLVEVTIDVVNQAGKAVLTDVTEAVVKKGGQG